MVAVALDVHRMPIGAAKDGPIYRSGLIRKERQATAGE